MAVINIFSMPSRVYMKGKEEKRKEEPRLDPTRDLFLFHGYK